MQRITNKQDFNKIYARSLTPKQHEVLTLFLAGHLDKEIAERIGVTRRSTATHHIQHISIKFGISPKTQLDYRQHLIELFIKYQPELVSAKTLERYGFDNIAPVRYPEGAEPLDSPFYLERSDSECYGEIEQSGALIRIKAPKQMGKTSLLKRILAQGQKNNYHIAYLNFSVVEAERLSNPNEFFRGFYNYVVEDISQAPPLQEWDKSTYIVLNCTRQFQVLLKQLNGILILALDEVDRVLEYPEIAQTFFALLRHWHEKRNDSEIWKNIRLVIAHSTEDYGRLDINQSPFNVGVSVLLEEFTQEQITILASRHGLKGEIVNPLMSIVGGHPYLIRLAMYYLVRYELTFEQLLKDAPTDSGIYKAHLLRHLETLENNSILKKVFRSIVTHHEPLHLEQETQAIYQLYSMGLIKQIGDLVKPRCELYRLYFRSRLNE